MEWTYIPNELGFMATMSYQFFLINWWKKKDWFCENCIPFEWKYWNFNWIEFQFNYIQFNNQIKIQLKRNECKLVEKILKIWSWMWCWKRKPWKRHLFMPFYLGMGFWNAWIIWTKTCAYLGTSNPDLGSFMLGFDSYWDLKICMERRWLGLELNPDLPIFKLGPEMCIFVDFWIPIGTSIQIPGASW